MSPKKQEFRNRVIINPDDGILLNLLADLAGCHHINAENQETRLWCPFALRVNTLALKNN